jgi:hypothetical protein
MPTPPPMERPAAEDEWQAWRDGHLAYNKWIIANRHFLVARACDLLEAKQAALLTAAKGEHVKMESVEIICLVLGVTYLQGAETTAPSDLFSILLGGH